MKCECVRERLCVLSVTSVVCVYAWCARGRHRACSCEVDVNTTQWLQEAKWVQKYAATLSAGGPQIGAIIAQPPPGFGTQPVSTFSALLDELQRLPLVRGVRPQIPSVADSSFHAAMREAGRRGLVIDVNHGYQPPSSRLVRGSAAGGVVEEIVAAAPNTTFVIEHMWGAPGIGNTAADGVVADWKAALQALARYCRDTHVGHLCLRGLASAAASILDVPVSCCISFVELIVRRRYPNVGCLQIGGMMAAWGHSSPYVVNKTVVIDRINAGIEAFGYHRVCFGAAKRAFWRCQS